MDEPQQLGIIKPGIERWATKTGIDKLASNISLSPIAITIADLIVLPAPVNPDRVADRIGPTEDTVYQIEGTLIGYKEEQDGDYHLVIADSDGKTMIAEIPNPAFCDGSAWLVQITAARQAFDDKFHKEMEGLRTLSLVSEGVPMITRVSVPVQLTGVGFFDKLHGQTGVAPNGIELHPVLSIKF